MVCRALLVLAGTALALAAQGRSDHAGITVEAGAALLHREPVEYPFEARRQRIEGVVLLEVSLDAEGIVTDARVLSGPEELRRAALQSVLQWHYSKDAGRLARVQVAIHFRLPDETDLRALESARELDRRLRAESGATRGALRIHADALPEPLRQTLRGLLAEFEGQPMSNELMTRIGGVVSGVDRHVKLGWRSRGAEGCCSLILWVGATPSSFLPGDAASSPPSPAGPGRIRVGAAVQSQNLIHKVQPEYPPLAKQARITGTVKLDAVIGQDGRVLSLTVVSGHPLLVPAALEAVRQWVYKPTLLNGAPVEVLTQIDVTFSLSQ